MPSSSSHFATEQASRLLVRLCRHFSHKIDAQWDEREGRLVFSIGECRLLAAESGLGLQCCAPTAGELDELQEVLRRHLQGFAQVEELVLQWH